MKKIMTMLCAVAIATATITSCNKEEETEPKTASVQSKIEDFYATGDISNVGAEEIKEFLTKELAKAENFEVLSDDVLSKSISNWWNLVQAGYSENDLKVEMHKRMNKGGKKIEISSLLSLYKDGVRSKSFRIEAVVTDNFISKTYKIEVKTVNTGLTTIGNTDLQTYFNKLVDSIPFGGETTVADLDKKGLEWFDMKLATISELEIKNLLIQGLPADGTTASTNSSIKLLSDGKEMKLVPYTVSVDGVERNVSFKIETKLAYAKGLTTAGKASLESYLNSLKKDFTYSYTPKPTLTKSTATKFMTLEQVRDSAKAEFLRFVNGINLDDKVLSGIVASKIAEMLPENVNVKGSAKPIFSLVETGTGTLSSQEKSSEQTKVRNTFMLTHDFGGGEKTPAEVNIVKNDLEAQISNFKSAHNSNAVVKQTWKNLTTSNSSDIFEATNLYSYLENTAGLITFANVKIYSVKVSNYEKLQNLFDAGVRASTYWCVVSGIIPAKKLLDNRAIDPNFKIKSGGTDNTALTWTFAGISTITPAIVNQLLDISTIGAIKVHPSSPVIETSGDFTSVSFSLLILYWDVIYVTTNFRDTNGDAIIGEEPLQSFLKRDYFARYRAIKGSKHSNDTYTN